MINLFTRITLTVFMLACTQVASAQLLLNEVLVNPPGADDAKEFIELKGTPGSTLNNIYVVVFEGDSADAGNADLVIPLNDVTLGSNGLLFIGTSLGYSISAPTVFKDTLVFGLPILENGNTTFAVLFSPIPMLTNVDYDTNNDGTLDLPQGAVLQDAVGWTNGDLYALVYGGVILTQSAGTPDAAVRFFDNTTPFSKPAWYNGDLTAPSTFDPLEISSNFPTSGAGITPGGINVPNNGTGLQGVEVESHIHPNPATDAAVLSMPSGQWTLELRDVQGRLVWSGTANGNQHRFDLNALSDGMYHIRGFSTQGNVVQQKLIRLQ